MLTDLLNDFLYVDNEVKQKAELISATRILTDDDFKKIQQKSISVQLDGGQKKGKKRKHTTTASKPTSNDEVVSLAQIENVHKKMRHDKESRFATVLGGRVGREKYGQRKQERQNENASTTIKKS